MITMLPIRPLLAAALAATAGTALIAAPAQAAGQATAQARAGTAAQASSWRAPATPVLVDVRASHHPGLDRLVFEFRGRVPAERDVRYVPSLVADASGRPVSVAGSAVLQVRFEQADGHDRAGRVTYGPARRTYALPGVVQVVNTGDFEATLSFGVGLARRAAYRVYTLTSPSRVVVDVATPYRTVPVRAYFLDTGRYAAGRTPYTTPVSRPVAPPDTAYGALQRLFAGPTQAERARGLRFAASGATGFGKLTVRDGVARVHLTGRCSSGGSTFTVADQIMPTLKQFPSIKWVKIYDAAGRTERPTGPGDSIPQCLEP
ncbi:GerMN domain-containing protein [Nonomuraea pusilla]|uniref:GerMN domain-containing protein n=1 Tax=Nonomuraea pusilla TaxID=46177 RepID=UPI0033201E8A